MNHLQRILCMGIYIVSYWMGDPFQSSLHTVTVNWSEEEFEILNSKTGMLPNEDQYICGYLIN